MYQIIRLQGDSRWEGLRAKDIIDLLHEKIAFLYGKTLAIHRSFISKFSRFIMELSSEVGRVTLENDHNHIFFFVNKFLLVMFELST